MKQGHSETITTRIISTMFVVVALAVFKPFGLDAWQWQAYIHLIAFGVIGFSICIMTDVILKYVIKMPRSFKKGAEYIIRRNLWFQLINTPLVALGICFYRHFVLSDRRGLQIPSNVFSAVNFLETLVIIAFCSFAIGLYWRFKFRSKYLAIELEEIRELNEQLKKPHTEAAPAAHPQPVGGGFTLRGTTNESVTLQISHLLFIEAVGNYVKVSHLRDGQVHNDMLRTTMKQMEETLQGYPMIVRCHRAFLVNLGQVEQIISHSGSTQLLIKHSHESLPVSRSNMAQVKRAINNNLSY